jgi:hypothetical protein
MSAAGDIGLCGKDCVGLYGEISQKTSRNFCATPRNAVERQNFTELDGPRLI